MQTVGFGGGCHWCTEAVFAALRGVSTVEQGFIRADAPNDTWSEAVRINFDPQIINLETLIDVHVCTHSATSNHTMRSKYRSAIYTLNADQADATTRALNTLQPEFDGTLVTQVLPLVDFNASDERFQRYYESGPDKPFCKRYIDPKLSMIRARFARHAA